MGVVFGIRQRFHLPVTHDRRHMQCKAPVSHNPRSTVGFVSMNDAQAAGHGLAMDLDRFHFRGNTGFA
jgi:hypothetical protein